MSWKAFEEDCCNYLNSNLCRENVSFKLNGGHDSTKSDIESIINNKFEFCIEVKEKEAQSGQFVLLDDGSKLTYSPRNKSEINDFSNLILDYMNKNYNTYRDVSTNSLEVVLPKNIFESWILNHYSNKKVKYVITNNGHDYIIFPLDKYGEYFSIKANFRIKGSGSSSLPKCDKDIVSKLVNSNYGENNISFEGKKAFCSVNLDIPDKCKLTALENNRTYQFNKVDSNKYEVRKLSNTRNANVIFSIKLIKNQCVNDLNIFKKEFI